MSDTPPAARYSRLPVVVVAGVVNAKLQGAAR